MEPEGKSDLDVEKANAELARAGAHEPCPACRYGQWELDPMRYFMAGISGGRILEDYGLAVLVVRCGRCGFVRLHSTSKLGL